MGANPDWHKCWSTANEISYINDLVSKKVFIRPGGNYLPHNSPIGLLTNYIRSAKKRRDFKTFGDVDTKTVIRYAEDTLEKLTGS